MTNGEKIQTILNVDRDCTEVHGENGTMTFTVTQEFWNAEYKEPNKNDLGIDCISRQAVRKILVEAEEFGSWDDSSQINRLDAIDNVDMLPSVTPQEPRKGHWIKYGIPRCGEQHYKCTNCDEYFNFGLYSDYYKKAFKYCPNCGAKMVESEEI